MGFAPISIDRYIKMHLKNNSRENEKDLRKRINSALSDYNKGVKCDCGNDIWVIGSASVGNSCFSCITGEAYPNNDYEIDSVLKKKENTKARRHIDEIPPAGIAGYFDDDGNKLNPDLIEKPSLCITCINDDDPNEEILCTLTRLDQKDGKEFICFAYSAKKS